MKHKSKYLLKIKGMSGGKRKKFKKNNGNKRWLKTRRRIARNELR